MERSSSQECKKNGMRILRNGNSKKELVTGKREERKRRRYEKIKIGFVVQEREEIVERKWTRL